MRFVIAGCDCNYRYQRPKRDDGKGVRECNTVIAYTHVPCFSVPFSVSPDPAGVARLTAMQTP